MNELQMCHQKLIRSALWQPGWWPQAVSSLVKGSSEGGMSGAPFQWQDLLRPAALLQMCWPPELESLSRQLLQNKSPCMADQALQQLVQKIPSQVLQEHLSSPSCYKVVEDVWQEILSLYNKYICQMVADKSFRA
jgi:hypothetical protein